MQYELFYLVGGSREADLEKIKNDAEEIVKTAGGNFSEKTTVEKRRLSYEVKHENYGIYIARRFELENGEMIKEITKKMNLNGNILRFLVSRADELPELKSKEERMASTVRAESQPKEKKEAPVAKKEPAPAAKEEKETPKEEVKKEEPKDDDIDKKLEEILNI